MDKVEGPRSVLNEDASLVVALHLGSSSDEGVDGDELVGDGWDVQD